jgi:acyl-CoA reductase-like NAD-dependent aldehyde dehydrogenase
MPVADCPQQALQLAELLKSTGALDGIYQIVFATTDQVATMIISPLLQAVSLTGAERAGAAASAAAKPIAGVPEAIRRGLPVHTARFGGFASRHLEGAIRPASALSGF